MAEAECNVYPVTDAEIVSQRPLDGDCLREPLMPRLLGFALRRVLPCIFLILPVCFGGVHQSVYLPVYTLLSALAATLILVGRPALTLAFPSHTLSRSTFVLLSCFLGYCVAQGILLELMHIEHPVLGTTGALLRPGAFLEGILAIVFFLGSFLLVRTALSAFHRFSERLRWTLLASGAIVALIALSHWFYDNGKLFWVFEPDYLHISERARWPFVNPNHLAHFLLPIAFLFVGQIGNQFAQLRRPRPEPGRANNRSFANLIQSSRLQRGMIRLAFEFCFLIAILLAIFASLSRGSWFGLALGFLCYFALTKMTADKVSLDSPGLAQPVESKRRRRSGRRVSKPRENQLSMESVSKVLSGVARPALLILAIVLFVLFLGERGRDLISERIDYGLMSSKDDIRWQMYADSMPLFWSHPIFGTGLGSWAALYPQRMTPLLAGLEPVYLHSDPLQVLIETGSIGAVILIALFIKLTSDVLRALRQSSKSQGQERRALTALLSGSVALIAAAFVDFPFRMPAISLLVAGVLALTTFYSDKVKSES